MKPRHRILTLLLALLTCALSFGGGCDREDQQATPEPRPPVAADTTTAPSTTRPANLPRIVFLGDSLTAGLGLSAEEAFPALVGEMLERDGLPAHIVNAGVSGDTTAGGLRRLDWLLRQSPDIIVVGLGGNDGLRGLDVQASRDNLAAIVRKSRDAGAQVLLLGMLIPPNYGPEYVRQFAEVYPQLARELKVPLVPFLLDRVGGERELNQRDGIHPTAEGHRILAENVLPHLRPMVREIARKVPATQPADAPDPA